MQDTFWFPAYCYVSKLAYIHVMTPKIYINKSRSMLGFWQILEVKGPLSYNYLCVRMYSKNVKIAYIISKKHCGYLQII